MDIKTPQQWGEIYKQRFDQYDRFRQKLESLFLELLQFNNLEFSYIESRTKDINKFIEKINNKGYKNLLEEMTDLVGISIITYYTEDIGDIARAVKKEFILDLNNSVDKIKIIEDDKFGYLSLHHIISLPSSRTNHFEWQQFSNLKAEVQIRTVLEHAWASVSHKITYKNERVKNLFKREFSRLSALLELADDQFLGLKKRVIEIEQYYSNLDRVTDLSLDKLINFRSLKDYLIFTNIYQKLLKIAEDCGFKKYKPLKSVYEDQVMNDQCYILLDIISRTDIKTIIQLNTLLIDKVISGSQMLKKILKTSHNDIERDMIFLSRQPFWVMIFFIILEYKNAFIQDMESLKFHQSIKNMILKAIAL